MIFSDLELTIAECVDGAPNDADDEADLFANYASTPVESGTLTASEDRAIVTRLDAPARPTETARPAHVPRERRAGRTQPAPPSRPPWTRRGSPSIHNHR